MEQASGMAAMAYETLKNMILSQQIKPGEHIPEIKLANQLGISRTPMREAIKRLAADGIVTMYPNRYAEVTVFREGWLQEVGIIRLALDTVAAHLAIHYGSNYDFSIMDRYNEACRQAAKDGNMAERIKIHVGSALTDLGDQAPDDFVVHGPNRITALPMEVPVCYQEIAHCLDKTVAKIENAVLSALENTPPELYADIVKNGIYLSGGGALLRGLDKRLTDKINIPFHIAEDPLHSVAKGAGIALKNVERFSFLMR